MQRPEQRHAPDAGVIPARLAQQVPGGQDQEQRTDQRLRLQCPAEGVQHADQRGADQQRPVQPGPGLDLLYPPQPALGEEGNHPATDQRHHRAHQPQASHAALALPVVLTVGQAGQGQRVGGGQQAEHHHDRVVARLPHGQEQPGHLDGHGNHEQQIERDQHDQRQIQQPGQTPGQPDQRNHRQRLAGQAWLAGPGLHGGEQEAGNDGRGKGEDHLVTVPGQPAAGGLPVGNQAAPGQDPQGYREQREDAASEEKRPEGQTPDRRNTQRLAPIDDLHGRPPDKLLRPLPLAVAGWRGLDWADEAATVINA